MSSVEVRDVADGLWLWRQPHPAWQEGNDWVPEVASFAVRASAHNGQVSGVSMAPRVRAPNYGTVTERRTTRCVDLRLLAVRPTVVRP